MPLLWVKKVILTAYYPTREGGLDYFEKNPERIYTSREKGKKRFNLKSIFKGVLTIGGIIAGGAAIVKIKKIPAINTGNPITKGIKTAGGFISSKTSSAGGSISGALHGAGSFISNKFHAAGGFIKRKFSRP